MKDQSQVRWKSAQPDAGLTWGKDISGSPFIAKVDQWAKFSPEKVVLEIGPGYGRLVKSLVSKELPFSEYYATDLSENNCEYLRQTFLSEKMHFLCNNVETVVLPKPFDIGYSSLTFKHIYPSCERAFKNLCDQANPDAVLVIDMLEGFNPPKTKWEYSYFEGDGVTFIHHYTREELTAMLDRSGWTLIGFDYVEHDAGGNVNPDDPARTRLVMIAKKQTDVSVKDVVLATVKGYGWPEVMPFANSLGRTGFKGSKVMFVENITGEARERLTKLGWELVDVIANPKQNYATARHAPVAEFLTKNHEKYRYAIYADARDLVFQGDPTVWLEENLGTARIIGPSECLLIGTEPVNSRWIKEAIGEEAKAQLAQYEVCCCGTIVGCADTVGEIVDKMYEMASAATGWGYDQAYFNYLIRLTPYRDVLRVPKAEEGFITSCGFFLYPFGLYYTDKARTITGNGPLNHLFIEESPVFDKAKGLVLAPGSNRPFPILHQYDRSAEWKSIIHKKYSEANVIPPPPPPPPAVTEDDGYMTVVIRGRSLRVPRPKSKR